MHRICIPAHVCPTNINSGPVTRLAIFSFLIGYTKNIYYNINYQYNKHRLDFKINVNDIVVKRYF